MDRKMEKKHKASAGEEEAVQSTRCPEPRNPNNGTGKLSLQASPRNSDAPPRAKTARRTCLLHKPAPNNVSTLVTSPKSQQSEDETAEGRCQTPHSSIDNDDAEPNRLTTPGLPTNNTPCNARTIIMMVSPDGSSSCLSFPGSSPAHGDASESEGYESEDDMASDPSPVREERLEVQESKGEDESLLEPEAEKGSPKSRSPKSQPSSSKSRKPTLPRGCYFKYLLRSAPTGEWYIGKTYDPLQRLGEHNFWFKKGSNIAEYTKDEQRRPWCMVALVRVEEVGNEGNILVQRQEMIWSKQLDGLHQDDPESKATYTNKEVLAALYETICRPEFDSRPYEIRFMAKDVALAFEEVVKEKGLERRIPWRIVKDYAKRGEDFTSQKCQTRLLSKVAIGWSRQAAYLLKADAIARSENDVCCTKCKGAIIPGATGEGDYIICPAGQCRDVSHIQCLRERFREDELKQFKPSDDDDYEKTTFPTVVTGSCATCSKKSLWQDYVMEAKIRNEWTLPQREELIRVCMLEQKTCRTTGRHSSESQPPRQSESDSLRDIQLPSVSSEQGSLLKRVVLAVKEQHKKYGSDPSTSTWMKKISLRHIICEGRFKKWFDEHIDNAGFREGLPTRVDGCLAIANLKLVFNLAGISTALLITSRRRAAKEYFRTDDMAWVWPEDERIRAEIEGAKKAEEDAAIQAAERRREGEAREAEEKKAEELAEANKKRIDAERKKAEQRISQRQAAARKREQERIEKEAAERMEREQEEREEAEERRVRERKEDEERAEAERQAAAQFKEDQARWEKKWRPNLPRAKVERESEARQRVAVPAHTPGQVSRKRRMSVETLRINHGEVVLARSVRARPLTGAADVTTPLRRSPRGHGNAAQVSSIKGGSGFNTARPAARTGCASDKPLRRSPRLGPPASNSPNIASLSTLMPTGRPAQTPVRRIASGVVRAPVFGRPTQMPAPRIRTGVPRATVQHQCNPSTPANPASQTPRRTSPCLSELSTEKHMMETMLWALECYAKLTAHNNRKLEGILQRECDKYAAANWSRAKPKWAEVSRTKEGREFKARMRRLIEDSNKGFLEDEKGDAKNGGYKVKDVEKVGLVHYYMKAGRFEVELNVSMMNPRY